MSTPDPMLAGISLLPASDHTLEDAQVATLEMQRRLLAKTKTDKVNTLLKKSTQTIFS